MPCSRYGNTLTRISKSSAILYGGNNLGLSGWKNGDCWLLDLEKARELSIAKSDRAKKHINDNMDKARDAFNFYMENVEGFYLEQFRATIDGNFEKAKKSIITHYEKTKNMHNTNPSSIWTQVSNHMQLPRVHHRDAIVSADHHVDIFNPSILT